VEVSSMMMQGMPPYTHLFNPKPSRNSRSVHDVIGAGQTESAIERVPKNWARV